MNLPPLAFTPPARLGPRPFRPGDLTRRCLHAAALLLGLGLLLLFIACLHTPEGEPVRDFFFTFDNFKFIAVQAAVVGVGALGMTLVMASGGVDLSAGGAAALCGVTAACLLDSGHPPDAAFLAAVLTGGLVGLANGALVSTLRIAPFIATLGMLGVVRGLAQWAAGGAGAAISIPASWIGGVMAPFPAYRWMLVAPGVWMALLLAGAVTVLLRNTVFGRHLLAIGSNETAARLCGVRVAWTRALVYGTAGLFFGFAGFLQMARLHQGSPVAAPGLELDMIAAVLLGGGSLSGGRGSVPGSVLGVLLLTILRNGLQQAGWPPYTQEIVGGVVIVAAVALDRFRRGRTAAVPG